MSHLSRRQLILGSVLAAGMLAFEPARAATIPYTPFALGTAKASGKPFILDFFADWCTTCAAQHRVLDRLRANNPAYDAIPFVQVDWDAEEHGSLVRAMRVPRRSTLIVLKGDKELGRIIAETSEDKIAALLKLAL
jgi:thiol-disulfide isomerase/thioredoxin